MRKITRDEHERWLADAKAHGFTDDEGHFGLGRFVVDGVEEGRILVRFITPLPAGLYSETLEKKIPPIMFDRTPAGEIILPGRWWQSMFERLSEEPQAPAEVRAGAARVARSIQAEDILLPAATDTVEILATDSEGNVVPHEALPPGGVIRLLHQQQEPGDQPEPGPQPTNDPSQWPWFEKFSTVIDEAIERGCDELRAIRKVSRRAITEQAIQQVFERTVAAITAAMPEPRGGLDLETFHGFVVAMQRPLFQLFVREARWLGREP